MSWYELESQHTQRCSKATLTKNDFATVCRSFVNSSNIANFTRKKNFAMQIQTLRIKVNDTRQIVKSFKLERIEYLMITKKGWRRYLNPHGLWASNCSITLGSANVEMSPNWSSSFVEIFLRTRLNIFPLRVLGRPRHTFWMNTYYKEKWIRVISHLSFVLCNMIVTFFCFVYCKNPWSLKYQQDYIRCKPSYSNQLKASVILRLFPQSHCI